MFTALLTACSDGSDKRGDLPGETYRAENVWTEYGIPHVTAQDWGSLGFGIGNAFAQQNFCSYMREIASWKTTSRARRPAFPIW